MATDNGNRLPFTTRADDVDGADGSDEDEVSIAQVFEILLAEWHITQDYIIAHWTDEEFTLMVEKLSERKERERAIMKGETPPDKVPEAVLFNKAGIKVKRGN